MAPLSLYRLGAALWAALFVPSMGPFGLVLCSSADGQVTLEIRASGGCADCPPDTAPAAQPAAGPRATSDSGCGPCVDVPLLAGPASVHPTARGADATGIASLEPAAETQPLLPTRPPVRPPGPDDTAIDWRTRTVILLI